MKSTLETCTLVTCVVCGKSHKHSWEVCYIGNKNYPNTLPSPVCLKCIRKKPKP